MSISTPFIRRPIATSLLTAAIFLTGLVAYPMLPVAPLPNVQFPTLTVTAQYPGASPETMASTVATPLETEFGQMLSGLSQMTSASVLGTTQITLQFGLGSDLGNDETLVLEAMNAAQGSLPKDLPNPPTFRAINPSDAAPAALDGVELDVPIHLGIDLVQLAVLAQRLDPAAQIPESNRLAVQSFVTFFSSRRSPVPGVKSGPPHFSPRKRGSFQSPSLERSRVKPGKSFGAVPARGPAVAAPHPGGGVKSFRAFHAGSGLPRVSGRNGAAAEAEHVDAGHDGGGGAEAAELDDQLAGEQRAQERDEPRGVEGERHGGGTDAGRKQLRQPDRHPGILAEAEDSR